MMGNPSQAGIYLIKQPPLGLGQSQNTKITATTKVKTKIGGLSRN
jgi:hypothetical protein